MGFLKAVFLFLRSWFVSKSNLAAENLALRQQLAVMSQSIKRRAASARSCFLDLAHAGMAEMAFCSADRQTGNGHPLAPPGISTLLALEVTSAESWTTCR